MRRTSSILAMLLPFGLFGAIGVGGCCAHPKVRVGPSDTASARAGNVKQAVGSQSVEASPSGPALPTQAVKGGPGKGFGAVANGSPKALCAQELPIYTPLQVSVGGWQGMPGPPAIREKSRHVRPKKMNGGRIVWPTIRGLGDKRISAAINKTLNFWDELNGDQDTASYTVLVDRGRLLSLRIILTWHGAGSVEDYRHFLFDLRSGKEVIATNLFGSDEIARLAHLANQRLAQTLRLHLKAVQEDSKPSEETPDNICELLGEAKVGFNSKTLDNFWFLESGIVFVEGTDYSDMGYARSERALAPELKVYFRHKELRYGNSELARSASVTP